MAGNKALRRASETSDAVRINADVPLIVDKTELITADYAQEILNHNKNNRPVNWKQVEEYAAMMKSGEFKLTAQGIVIDKNGNLLTGQTRLWAVILSGCSVYMRVSRGNSPETGRLLDRGRQQSARDLASRDTEKKHAPTEASIARGVCALNGNMKPTKDELATVIAFNSERAKILLKDTAGMKKTRSLLMILSVISVVAHDSIEARQLVIRAGEFSELLDIKLLPHSAANCWGRGAAFGLALEHARQVVAGDKRD